MSSTDPELTTQTLIRRIYMAFATLAWNWQFFTCAPPYSPLEIVLIVIVSTWVISMARLAR